jgi:4-carboxymuconolactone decarboxylase
MDIAQKHLGPLGEQSKRGRWFLSGGVALIGKADDSTQSAGIAGSPAVPLLDVPDDVVKRLEKLGASDRARHANLYRALANQPEVLAGWVELSQRLRHRTVTSRRLRELMIVRGAQISGCTYELKNHAELALANGVTAKELEELARWRDVPGFSPAERAGLALAEGMLAGNVSDDVIATLRQQFDAAEFVELVVTAAFYVMVPQVVSALRVPIEDRHAANDGAAGNQP